MTPEELQQVRERASRFYATTDGSPALSLYANIGDPVDDVGSLLAHVDGVEAAIESLPFDDDCAKHYGNMTYACSCRVDRAAVLAILQGRDPA